MKRRLVASALAALALAAAPAAAQPTAPQPLETRLEARKVATAADGKESYSDAAAARPGDVIEYVATYRNAGKVPITRLEATLPIPSETELVADSVRPAGARASVDGKTFAPLPLKRARRVDGRDIEEAVPLREYRALRWQAAELGAGQQLAFSARVKVADDRNAARPSAAVAR